MPDDPNDPAFPSGGEALPLSSRLVDDSATQLAAQATTSADSAPASEVTVLMGENVASVAVTDFPTRVIGRYRLVEELGKGGFGMVWLAEQTEPIRREVALKVIKAGMDSAEIIARFEAERQALALMDHPNIASALDAGTTESGRPYFVMELVKGVPITEYCDAHRLTIAQRLELFIPVCQAVQHAHQKAILHRDLKPSNILVTEVDGKPVPKVIDFGIAKALGSAAEGEAGLGLTREGAVIGTPQYMSPEQAGAGADLDTRSDIYTLGVILYELLTGGTPLPREQLRRAALGEVLRLIREADPVRPSSRVMPADEATRATSTARRITPAKLTRTLRGDLDWITLRALEKERERRYGSAAALAQDLQRHLRSEPVEAGPPSALYRFRKLVRRNQLAVGATIALVLLLFAGIGVSTWQAVRARRAEALAGQRLAQVEEEKKRGDEESAIALAVNEFLQKDLLRQAGSHRQVDQGHAPDPALTVREALDRAAQSIGQRFGDRPLVEAAIRHTLGTTYLDLGETAIGLAQLEQVVELRSKLLGAEHAETIGSRSNLGMLLYGEGRQVEAEREFRAVLAFHERENGAEDRETLNTRTNLAVVLGAQGKRAEAAAEHRAVLAVQERVLGPEHSNTLSSRHNLATMLAGLGRYAEAEVQYRIAATLRERVDGPDHPNTLSSWESLGATLTRLDRAAEAEPIVRKVVAALTRVMGAEHRQTLGGRSNLGSALHLLKRYAEAEAEHRAVLAVRERVRGAEHRETLESRSNLANALNAQGQHAEAEAEHRSVLIIRERLFGAEHLETLRSRSNLALALQGQNKYAAAEIENRAVLTARERLLGPEHADTLYSRNKLGLMLHHQRKYAEATEVHRRELAIRGRAQGVEHPETLSTRVALASALHNQGKSDEAEAEYQAVLSPMERVLGAEHATLLLTCHNLAVCLDQQKKRDEALAFAQRALAGREKVLGAEHADTKRSRALVDKLSAPAAPPPAQ